MTTYNPYGADPVKGAAFELGYIWGFTNPGAGDNPPPYSPELLDIYLEGVDSGKDDWNRPPDGPLATSWVHWSELEEQTEHEWLHHLFVEGFAEAFNHLWHTMGQPVVGAAHGLAGLLITVLSIPGDTMLHPLPEDFEQLYAGPEDSQEIWYAAACCRNDHVPEEGATSDGYWFGTPSNDFAQALREAVGHAHSEALVARCNLADQTCGLVWAAR